MADYSSMSAEELLDEMDSDVVEGYPRDEKKVFALRKAVTREAAVAFLTGGSMATLVQTPQDKGDTWSREREPITKGQRYALVRMEA